MNITARILELDQRYFPYPWTESQWKELNPANHLLFSHGNEGFALFMRIPGDEMAHLLKICLRPENRGYGEALKFWDEILKELRDKGIKSIYLEVEAGNHRARGFYSKIGFKKLRQIPGYYSDGEDAVTMDLDISEF